MEGSLRDLSKYRFENGLESLEDARIMFNIGDNSIISSKRKAFPISTRKMPALMTWYSGISMCRSSSR